MRRIVLIALLFIAISSINTRAIGQTVYKCGNAYSQVPCPGGVKVEANDNRTPAEKAQRDALTAQTARTADQMEQGRLAQEQKDLLANSPRPAPAAKAPVADEQASTLVLAKKPKLIRPKKKPEGFIAIVPGSQKPHKPRPPKSADPANKPAPPRPPASSPK